MNTNNSTSNQDTEDMLPYDKICNWINNPDFFNVSFYKLRDYILKEYKPDVENPIIWPYGLSKRLANEGYIEEAQKLQIKLFNNVENLLDIYSPVHKYVLDDGTNKYFDYDSDGLQVLDYLSRNTEPFNPRFFFQNLHKAKKYSFSFCKKSYLESYLTLGHFSENEDDDWLFKHEFFESVEFQKKGIYNAIFKNKKGVMLFLFWNGKFLDSNLFYNKSTIYINENSNTKKKFNKLNSSRVVRIFNELGDLYDLRIEEHRKLLPGTGSAYQEAEMEFEVLRTNMCI